MRKVLPQGKQWQRAGTCGESLQQPPISSSPPPPLSLSFLPPPGNVFRRPLFMKREPLVPLIIPDEDCKKVLAHDSAHVPESDPGPHLAHQQPTVHVSLAEEDVDPPVSRPASASSSLDPYYFGLRSPSVSPVPPLPPLPTTISSTPDQALVVEPATPARDPASIDRRELVGVGELATPRWARTEQVEDQANTREGQENFRVATPEGARPEQPDSPWTIEAVDGELSEKEELTKVQSTSQPFRARPSIAEESGGEEILYPRKSFGPIPDVPPLPDIMHPEEQTPRVARISEEPSNRDHVIVSPPPHSYISSVRKAKKRSSEEFEMDQFGILASKQSYPEGMTKDKVKDDKFSSRKHRSLNMSVSTNTVSRDGKSKERRRGSTDPSLVTPHKVSSTTPRNVDRHTRQTSAGPTIPTSNENASRRSHSHTNDFSHLPPSPAASMQTHTPAGSKSGSQSHSAVAHSVLRGPQEGWSELDDEVTAEALRKLDGLSGKTTRVRSSVGSLGRPSSFSRPSTPAGKPTIQREGLDVVDSVRVKRGWSRDGVSTMDKDRDSLRLAGAPILKSTITDYSFNVTSSDEQAPTVSVARDKTPKKPVTSGARSSFTLKRGSTSSTNYASTPTTSSRELASVSVSTSLTSISATSGRLSTGKVRRNSGGSDSIHFSDASSMKDRVASLAGNGDLVDDNTVPPVPPLPKDLSAYRSPHPSISGLPHPSSTHEDINVLLGRESHINHEAFSDAFSCPSPQTAVTLPSHRQSQHYPSGFSTLHSAPESAPSLPKTPSKKWSFSALNIKLSSPASTTVSKPAFPLSPRSVTFGSRSNPKGGPKDDISAGHKGPWSPKQPGAMDSEGSLVSLSSVGSMQHPVLQSQPSKTPDAGAVIPSRSSTASSASTNLAPSVLIASQPGPLSPASSTRRNQSKRLTPSSIPFFRRSSSQSMQVPPPVVIPSSPTFSASGTQTPSIRRVNSSSKDHNQLPMSAPSSAQKKSSVLSLGFPSLLKSSSRRSLHSDAKESAKESQRIKDTTKEREKERSKQTKQEKEKHRKEDKDRSESRISLLMSGGRKRGKTLSSMEPRKPKSPINLPPMQVPALEPATAQRVARLKPGISPAVAAPTPLTTRSTSTSRVASQTASSMQKQSDTSLRSRTQLPTIAGSPSIGTSGTNSSQTLKDLRELPVSHTISNLPKETPTKIPRISSRTSAAASPPLKSFSGYTSRRTSAQASGISTSNNPSPIPLSTNEFGVVEMSDDMISKSSIIKQQLLGTSPTGSSRLPRQASASISLSSSSVTKRANRDSVSYGGIRKPSTSSIASLSMPAVSVESASRHFAALSPSKGLKLLSPKISLSSARGSNVASVGSNTRQGSPSSNRRTPSTPSPAPSSVDEDELMGDDEMMQYIKRQHAKKLAAGATQEELDKLLQFPEPIPPGSPSSPTAILQSSKVKHLSDYERKEILDYPSVYYAGEHSRKNQAMLDNPANNYGYDDDRGDYLVISRDHLAYRYEIIDTLGKGSFGQVLHCRDHCTGESVAIKIIRNKKRFHHQALVEIRILDKLRAWDAEEKHNVIKMTEHFYFRNHLCIAMELLSINLYELIKANGFVGFTTALIRRFTGQMLMSLSLMRQYRIVHCDLKPENVLLRHPSRSAIKVIDFGSSCFENEKIYTYIQSRFYRSPEVILGMNYHMAIDMWSLGCILAELYTGFPIFPGENEQEQLSCIMEVLGIPDKDFVNRSSRKKLFFEPNGTPRVVVNTKGRRRRPGTKTLSQVLKCNDEEFVDFISKCLVWDPERRMKPQAALRHPFVTAGRKLKTSIVTSRITASSSLNSSRNKQATETPKKSMISAPTPLTARSSRTMTGGPTTPSNSSHASSLGSSTKSYRTSSHLHGLSSYHSSRALSGFAVCSSYLYFKNSSQV
ncbi:hypothetical protein AX17_003314 [Amanita inopinata Kibby_2008]|nr:hypothetical protein AX17_003314 [Amanita inopinata Kibby_2008]